MCAALPALSCNGEKELSFEEFTGFRAASAIDVQEPAFGQMPVKPGYCSISAQLSMGLGLMVGDQVRIYRTVDEYALYTISELREEMEPGMVRMTKEGRERLGTQAPFVGQLDTNITATGLTDEEARAHGEFVEQLIDDGVQSGLLVAAVHGGRIEFLTDHQAERLVELLPGVSSWICKGWRDPEGAYARWHVESKNLSPNSFLGLAALADRGFEHVVSFHGMSKEGVVIGGLASQSLREELRAAIVDAIGDPNLSVEVAVEDGPLTGSEPANFVNWLTADGHGGMQIESGPRTRTLYWSAIAEAIAGVIGPLL
jgi:phage replication-related protein YjqB (UPF0714/DUF867 family)